MHRLIAAVSVLSTVWVLTPTAQVQTASPDSWQNPVVVLHPAAEVLAAGTYREKLVAPQVDARWTTSLTGRAASEEEFRRLEEAAYAD